MGLRYVSLTAYTQFCGQLNDELIIQSLWGEVSADLKQLVRDLATRLERN